MKTLHPLKTVIFLLTSVALSGQIDIDTVFVGDAGNSNDSTGYGAVSYDYYIGTYEVTNAQYTSFLNATAATDTYGLYNPNMGSSTYGGINRVGTSGSYTYSVKSGSGDKPVNFVSFWDAARFTNWLTSGNTETGVYVLTSNGITNNTITRDATAWANGGVAIASENEWYKAAYYSGSPTGADGDGYWSHAVQSNSISTSEANYGNSVGNVTSVGAYNTSSHYGTFDQGGNVWEWNDEILFTSRRGLRGGSFNRNVGTLQSSTRSGANPTSEFNSLGFRVSSLAPIPEPSTYAAIFGGLVLILALLRRRKRA